MFIIGILPAFLLLYVRQGVEEPALWVAADRGRRDAQKRLRMGGGSPQERKLAQFTLTRIFSEPELRRRVGLLLLMSIATVVGWWSVSTWIPVYATQLRTGAGTQVQLSSSFVGLMFSGGSIMGFLSLGVLADILGRKLTTWLFYLGALVLSLCFFLVVRERNGLLITAAASGFFSSGQFAWMTIYLPEVFPTPVRGTAMSLVFDSSRSIAGLGPLLAGWLISYFGGIGKAATVMSLIYIVGLIVTPFAGPETKGKPLPT
jgi:MFS family permease